MLPAPHRFDFPGRPRSVTSVADGSRDLADTEHVGDGRGIIRAGDDLDRVAGRDAAGLDDLQVRTGPLRLLEALAPATIHPLAEGAGGPAGEGLARTTGRRHLELHGILTDSHAPALA